MDPVSLLVGAAVMLGVLFLGNLVGGFRAPPAGHALLVSRQASTEVVFDRAFVVPGVHRTELLDVTAKALTVDRRRRAALSCADGVRADVIVTVTVQAETSREGVLHLARTLGSARAGKVAAIAELLEPRIAEAVQVALLERPFEAHLADRAALTTRVAALLGPRLDAFQVQSVAVDHLAQAALDAHHPDDVRDAEGIRALTAALETTRTATAAAEHAGAIARAQNELEARRELSRIDGELMALGGAPLGRSVVERLRARESTPGPQQLTEADEG